MHSKNLHRYAEKRMMNIRIIKRIGEQREIANYQQDLHMQANDKALKR